MKIVGLGQPAAGDDGVGLAVIEALRADPPAGAVLVGLRDAAPLVDLLDGGPVVLVDAVVGVGAPGELRWIEPSEVARTPLWSTHGIGVREAIGLAEALRGPEASAGLRVLGVTIAPPCPSMELTLEVAGAVGRAAAEIRRFLEARRA